MGISKSMSSAHDDMHVLCAAAQLVLMQRDASRSLLDKPQQTRMSVRLQHLKQMQPKDIVKNDNPVAVPCLEEPTKHTPKKSIDKLLGRKVCKQFFNKSRRLKWYTGKVVKVSRTDKAGFFYKFEKDVTSTVKYLVKYEDKDSEHMTRWQLQQHLVK